MKLSLAAELAIRGACVLAEGFGPDPIKMDDICAARDLPREYLAKIFGTLARAEIITPTRGKRGGYRLARDPSEITILNIIEAVEGAMSVNFCQHDPPQCDLVECPLRSVWGEIQQFMREKLSAVSLADYVKCAQT
jgi:Rrf2 family protein